MKYNEIDKYENEVYENNKNIVESISSNARYYYKKVIDGCDVFKKIEIVSAPKGENQNESFGCFKEVWVDQWSVGMEVDSFEGFIYARYETDKWIKIPYSC